MSARGPSSGETSSRGADPCFSLVPIVLLAVIVVLLARRQSGIPTVFRTRPGADTVEPDSSRLLEIAMPILERSPRCSTEDEVGRLLERATELQREEGESGGPTLGELEEMAQEGGIDPRLLRQAATELQAGTAASESGWSAVMGASAVAFPAGVLTASYVAARTAFSSVAARRRRALQDLIPRLSEAVTDASKGRIGPP